MSNEAVEAGIPDLCVLSLGDSEDISGIAAAPNVKQ